MTEKKKPVELDFHPLRTGKSFVQRMEQLIPKAESVLQELRKLRKQLENGWTDDW